MQPSHNIAKIAIVVCEFVKITVSCKEVGRNMVRKVLIVMDGKRADCEKAWASQMRVHSHCVIHGARRETGEVK